MSTNSINSLTSSYLQSILGPALQGTGLIGNAASNGVNGTSGQQADSGQLSPFAQLLSTLQQLQQSNPTEYQQVTQQIATNLNSAAQTATTDGNTSAATQLTQLANDFTTASQTGQLPNISDLAQVSAAGAITTTITAIMCPRATPATTQVPAARRAVLPARALRLRPPVRSNSCWRRFRPTPPRTSR